MRTSLLLLSCVLLSQAAEKVDFARDVQPILHTRCGGCHGSDKPQGGLSVLTRTALLKSGAVIPGASAKSPLIARVTATGATRMPLGQPPLNDHEIGILRSWIDAGAEWIPHSPPLPKAASIAPRRPAVPRNGHAHPIDAFIARHVHSKQVPFPALAPNAVFLRRAYLDVTGLLPSPEELDAFTADRTSNKRARLIDRLLQRRRQYAEHWITLWNDLLRNEDGVAYPGETRESDYRLAATSSGNQFAIRPYGGVPAQSGAEGSPRGFLAGINWGGDVSASQSVPMQAAQNSAQVFLGANLKCASCHDSFVSRWKLADIFVGGILLGQAARDGALRGEDGQNGAGGLLVSGVRTWSRQVCQGARAAALFTSGGNGRFARTIVNRYWRVLLGRALVEPVDDLDSPAWDADLLDWLATDFADHGYDLQFRCAAS